MKTPFFTQSQRKKLTEYLVHLADIDEPRDRQNLLDDTGLSYYLPVSVWSAIPLHGSRWDFSYQLINTLEKQGILQSTNEHALVSLLTYLCERASGHSIDLEFLDTLLVSCRTASVSNSALQDINLDPMHYYISLPLWIAMVFIMLILFSTGLTSLQLIQSGALSFNQPILPSNSQMLPTHTIVPPATIQVPSTPTPIPQQYLRLPEIFSELIVNYNIHELQSEDIVQGITAYYMLS